MWQIENNLFYLITDEGFLKYLSAAEIILMTKKDSVDSSFSLFIESKGIRISQIGILPFYKIIRENNTFKLKAYVTKKSQQRYIGLYNGQFIDYILFDNVIYFVFGNHSRVKDILVQYNSCDNLSLLESFNIINSFKSEGIDFFDEITDQIHNEKNKITNTVPNGLKAKLYPYQQKGWAWLSYMVENGCGCILGDEMGLGKTMQIITLLGTYKEKHPNSHFLIGCPVSLLENWRRELNMFFPSLSVLINHGAFRTGNYLKLLEYDIIIMSYTNIVTDLSMLNMISWDIMIIDEAQNIKNPRALRTISLKKIKKKVAIAMTGTPFENHISDVWSITDFVIPSYLGELHKFENEYNDDIASASYLETIISPILLRRKVDQVAQDLPEKIVISHPIIMNDQEANYYENGRIQFDSSALKYKKLSLIQKLRMFCTHPFVYDNSLKLGDPINYSYKYSLMCDILKEIFDNNEKAVIFTSFNVMSDIIVNDCKRRFNVPTFYINGSISSEKRQPLIDQFSAINKSALLVLNPKAAGAGLNITTANHVIHYNLEWNPAVEDQASARCFRRGQTKTVFIHRLYYVNTIEEFINEKIFNKREISDTIIIGNKGDSEVSNILTEVIKYSPLN